MRKWFALFGVVFLFVGTLQAGEVKVKGLHLCCRSCEVSITKALSKVDGVSGVRSHRKEKSVSFSATNDKAAKAGIEALVQAGFFGKATVDGKAVDVKAETPKSAKAESVKVADVHVCCGACKRTIGKLFPDAKISYSGSGTQKTVTISQGGLDTKKVVEALRKGGFNGKVKK